eukprot:m.29116 g.29116  ORF g.29116 m.29116 type:complete len:67 (+) comp8064_c0_seq1:260-460(+)
MMTRHGRGTRSSMAALAMAATAPEEAQRMTRSRGYEQHNQMQAITRRVMEQQNLQQQQQQQQQQQK